MQHVKGYISFTGMHFVDAFDYHTLIIGECDVWKHVKYLLICKSVSYTHLTLPTILRV